VSPPNIVYSAILLIAGTLCLFVAILVSQTRRIVTGSFALTVLLFALAWWDITYAIFWADVPAPTRFFWLDITYIGVVITPVALFIFSLQISHRAAWLKLPLTVLMILEPIIVLIILFTDAQHDLFFGGKRMENSAFIQDGGPVFWFNVAFSYSLILLTTILLTSTFIRSSGIYRKQIGTILIGLGITWLNSVIFIIGINPLPGADNTPFSFTIAAIAFAYSLWRYRLLEIVPVARDVLIEKMTEGVLVMDTQNRIVDINPAAKTMLNISTNVLGEPIEQVLSHWKRSNRDALVLTDSNLEFKLAGKTYVDVQVTPITDDKGRDIGHVAVLHDITKLKNIQNELQLLATRDSLTAAFNRGHFMELAGREILRAKRYKRKLSLIMMDLDYFKKVNDTYGHQAGDQVLIMLANTCRHITRKMDVLARLGGEEFALLLPETTQRTALQTAERIRSSLENTNMAFDSNEFNVTVSMGVTEFGRQKNDTLEGILHRADRALYQAKEGGRNRVVLWKPEMG
jgi:diguanylate cyclase (GGDEF)-like protein/PAS domain S-box-containing protein